MAALPDIRISANDLTKSLRIHVRIKGVRMLRLRLAVAGGLFRLAGRIAGVPTRVEIDA